MRIILILILVASALMVNSQESGFYGLKFDTADPISVEALFEQLGENNEVAGVAVTGVVEDVCQVKGCWMTLRAEDGASMRVSFRDYGFFVPKDISGRTVVITGDGEVTVTSVADLKHYAEDEGQSPEEIAKITEPLEEYVFVADGVYIK